MATSRQQSNQQVLDRLVSAKRKQLQRLELIQVAAAEGRERRALREWNGQRTAGSPLRSPLLDVLPEGAPYAEFSAVSEESPCDSPSLRYASSSALSSAGSRCSSCSCWTPGGTAKRAYEPWGGHPIVSSSLPDSELVFITPESTCDPVAVLTPRHVWSGNLRHVWSGDLDAIPSSRSVSPAPVQSSGTAVADISDSNEREVRGSQLADGEVDPEFAPSSTRAWLDVTSTAAWLDVTSCSLAEAATQGDRMRRRGRSKRQGAGFFDLICCSSR